MNRQKLGYVVSAVGLVIFLAGWSVGSVGSSGRMQDHTPEAMYGGVAVFLAGVWLLADME